MNAFGDFSHRIGAETGRQFLATHQSLFVGEVAVGGQVFDGVEAELCRQFGVRCAGDV